MIEGPRAVEDEGKQNLEKGPSEDIKTIGQKPGGDGRRPIYPNCSQMLCHSK